MEIRGAVVYYKNKRLPFQMVVEIIKEYWPDLTYEFIEHQTAVVYPDTEVFVYKDRTIQDLWNSEKINEITEDMDEGMIHVSLEPDMDATCGSKLTALPILEAINKAASTLII